MGDDKSQDGGRLLTALKAITAIAAAVTAVFGVVQLFVDDSPNAAPASQSSSSAPTAGSSGGRTSPTSPTTPTVTPPDDFGPASVFLNRDSGPGGSTVKVSGEGFAAGERVTLRFHTEQIATTRANSQGKFSNVSVTIPSTLSKFAPQQFDLSATGAASIKSASAPFQLTG